MFNLFKQKNFLSIFLLLLVVVKVVLVVLGVGKSGRGMGGQGGQIMRSGDRDHPGQHGETPSLLKIQKNYQNR